MPARLNNLVVVLADDDAGQRLGQIPVQIRQNDPLIVGSRQEIKRLGGEARASNVRGVRAKGLDEAAAAGADVPQDAGAVLLAHGEQLAGSVDADGGGGASRRRTLHQGDAGGRSDVPQSHGFVLRSADEDRPAGVVESVDVTRVARIRLDRRPRPTVGQVDPAVTGAAGEEERTAAPAFFREEYQVSYGSVVHRQLHLGTWKGRKMT